MPLDDLLIPDVPEDVTAEWMTAALASSCPGVEVSGLEVHRPALGDDGTGAAPHRIRARRDGPRLGVREAAALQHVATTTGGQHRHGTHRGPLLRRARSRDSGARSAPVLRQLRGHPGRVRDGARGPDGVGVLHPVEPVRARTRTRTDARRSKRWRACTRTSGTTSDSTTSCRGSDRRCAGPSEPV